VQRDVVSHVTLHGDAVHVTLHVALVVQLTLALAPRLSTQLDAMQSMCAPSVATTSHVAPSVHVASHAELQLALHSALVHWRWQPVAVALHPATADHPHERPSGHAQPLAEHVHCAASQPGPFAA
jgi:hypothetical protein